jgi:prepilin-type N-terminal cleavage/methylation domain-containing protein
MREPDNTTRRGFSLIELLVVIAIIAILAALLFPAVVAQQAKARRNSCASNMQAIAGGLRMYKLDTGAYPPALYGFAHQTNQGTPGTVVYGLFPHWVKSREDFICPSNPMARRLSAQDAMRLPDDGDFANPNLHLTPPIKAQEMRKGAWAYGHRIPPPPELYPSGIIFPVGDSYDVNLVPYTVWRTDANNPALWERRYQRQWTPAFALDDPTTNLGAMPVLGNTPQERIRTYARQLQFKLPDDATVVTVCTYHRDYPTDWTRGDIPAGGPVAKANPLPAGSFDVVLYLDGHTEFRQSDQFNVYQDMNGVIHWAGWQLPPKSVPPPHEFGGCAIRCPAGATGSPRSGHYNPQPPNEFGGKHDNDTATQ